MNSVQQHNEVEYDIKSWPSSKNLKENKFILRLISNINNWFVFYLRYRIKYVFTQPLYHQYVAIQGQFLSGVQLVLNSEISHSKTGYLTKAKEPYNLPIAIAVREQMDSCLSQGY